MSQKSRKRSLFLPIINAKFAWKKFHLINISFQKKNSIYENIFDFPKFFFYEIEYQNLISLIRNDIRSQNTSPVGSPDKSPVTSPQRSPSILRQNRWVKHFAWVKMLNFYKSSLKVPIKRNVIQCKRAMMANKQTKLPIVSQYTFQLTNCSRPVWRHFL